MYRSSYCQAWLLLAICILSAHCVSSAKVGDVPPLQGALKEIVRSTYLNKRVFYIGNSLTDTPLYGQPGLIRYVHLRGDVVNDIEQTALIVGVEFSGHVWQGADPAYPIKELSEDEFDYQNPFPFMPENFYVGDYYWYSGPRTGFYVGSKYLELAYGSLVFLTTPASTTTMVPFVNVIHASTILTVHTVHTDHLSRIALRPIPGGFSPGDKAYYIGVLMSLVPNPGFPIELEHNLVGYVMGPDDDRPNSVIVSFSGHSVSLPATQLSPMALPLPLGKVKDSVWYTGASTSGFSYGAKGMIVGGDVTKQLISKDAILFVKFGTERIWTVPVSLLSLTEAPSIFNGGYQEQQRVEYVGNFKSFDCDLGIFRGVRGRLAKLKQQEELIPEEKRRDHVAVQFDLGVWPKVVHYSEIRKAIPTPLLEPQPNPVPTTPSFLLGHSALSLVNGSNSDSNMSKANESESGSFASDSKSGNSSENGVSD